MPLRSLALVAPLLLLTACADQPAQEPDTDDPPAAVEADTVQTPMSVPDGMSATEAVAVLSPTEGNAAIGRVTFTAVDGGVQIAADVSGLGEGAHGMHIHENGDCSAPDASSAGGHFSPDGSPHGAPDDPAAERHAGDLGNLDAEGGEARYERTDAVIQMSGTASIIGRSVIVHSGADDFTSQPSGDAGVRLACGVIEAVDA
ncbi:MAG: superoxide dismutase family protein [Bacteroidota bacterium]